MSSLPPVPPPLGTCARKELRSNQKELDVGFVGNKLLAFERWMVIKQDRKRDQELDIVSLFSSLLCRLDTSYEGPSMRRKDDFLLDFLHQAKSLGESQSESLPYLQKLVSELSTLLQIQPQHFSVENISNIQYSEEYERILRIRVGLSFCEYLQAQYIKNSTIFRKDLTSMHIFSALTSMMTGDTQAKILAISDIYDTDADRFLNSAEIERAVDSMTLPIKITIEKVFPEFPLDKKLKKALPRTLKYAMWDKLQFPFKRRTAFVFAEDKISISPTEFKISIDSFVAAQQKQFPELEKVATQLMYTFEDSRWDFYENRKKVLVATMYGFVLFASTVGLDFWSQIS